MASSARATATGSDNSDTGSDEALPILPVHPSAEADRDVRGLLEVEHNFALCLQMVKLPGNPLGYTKDVLEKVQELAMVYAIDALGKQYCCCVQIPPRHGKTRILINLARWEDAKVGGLATIVVPSDRALLNVKEKYSAANVIPSDADIPAHTTPLLVDNADCMREADLDTLLGGATNAWVATCSEDITGGVEQYSVNKR